MIIINQPNAGAQTYVISMGADQYQIHADTKDEAIEIMAQHLISSGKSDWCFSAIVSQYINTSELCYCPKYKIYLPKLTIEK